MHGRSAAAPTNRERYAGESQNRPCLQCEQATTSLRPSKMAPVGACLGKPVSAANHTPGPSPKHHGEESNAKDSNAFCEGGRVATRTSISLELLREEPSAQQRPAPADEVNAHYEELGKGGGVVEEVEAVGGEEDAVHRAIEHALHG